MRPGALIALGLAALALSAGAAAASGPSGVARATAANVPQAAGPMDHRGGPFAGASLFEAAASYIGITVDQLRTELGTDKSLADVAVAHGKTRDGLIAALQAAVNTSLGTFVDQKGAFGPMHDVKPGIGMGRGVMTDVVTASATYLGITVEDLRAKLAAGQTLAQIASGTAGKSRDGLVQALVADATAKIDAARAAGTITADQATQMKANLATHLANAVDQAGPGPLGGRGGMGGPRGRR
ncbi:MAG TPA: hypothetical protein VFM93_01175 [Candidatus Limnocylindria bacterium]|nr:hypothetical protein [Candidatus Limnocylindria bacterium]